MTNLQVATTGSNYAFWELFRYGEDKNIFEVYDSVLPDYIGKRYVMKQTKTGLVLKQLGTYDSDKADDIVVPYGVVTSAVFKRVEEFIPVTIGEAMEEIKEDKRNVFVQNKNGHFERVTIWTELSELEVIDFDNLFDRNFFIKK